MVSALYDLGVLVSLSSLSIFGVGSAVRIAEKTL